MRYFTIFIFTLILRSVHSQDLDESFIIGNWRVVDSFTKTRNYYYTKKVRKHIDSIVWNISKSEFHFNQDFTCSYKFAGFNNLEKKSFWEFNKKTNTILILKHKRNIKLVEEIEVELIIYIVRKNKFILFRIEDYPFTLEVEKY
jgi:hypothetical protein